MIPKDNNTMTINLNNYESFFLMYVDNELSASDRLSVETFVQQFPYLAEELELLKEMVLPANESIVMDKMNLYKSVAIGEREEETMLLHLDNELPAAEKEAWLQQVNNQPALKENWALLQKTKLDAGEIISFPEKALLYKRKAGRLVHVTFMRLAVAAALIAAGFFVGISILNNQNKTRLDVASTKNVLPKKDAVTPAVTNSDVTPADNTTAVAKIQGNSNKEVVVAAKAKAAQNKGTATIIKNSGKAQPTDFAGAGTIQNKKQDNTNRIAANDPEDLKIKRNENVASLTASLKNKTNTAPPDVHEYTRMDQGEQAVATLANLQEEETSDDHIFLLNEEVVTQSKAGVFFKKLKRTVARTANIKTGNSLKIAGFEFAVK